MQLEGEGHIADNSASGVDTLSGKWAFMRMG